MRPLSGWSENRAAQVVGQQGRERGGGTGDPGVVRLLVGEGVQQAVHLAHCSGADVDKFEEFDLTAVDGEQVQAPLVAECFANIECRVADTSLVAPYSLFLLEPVRVWTDPSEPAPRFFHHRGDGTFTLDGPTVDLQDRMTKWQYLL